jgi:hypothetical protein
MALSDPTMSVPTPTGVLQGVAVFNWDGAVWQPSGRAGPSVATPTGNLQGVAAFTGGPSWAPSGRAGPGVATPTGVLDGVAVYTWSGSAWTPPGGTETVPTPTGGLRGVAAFDWDGTAWQPAAQARSSVPTPYGVLDGVARFGWTGSAWAAVGAPSLSLDFMAPSALDPRITFTRASTATYTDASGTIQTAAVNAPRWDYSGGPLRGLLIEEARTNLCLQSAGVAVGGAWALFGNVAAAPIVTANNAVAPDGTTTATRMVMPAVSGGGSSVTYQPFIATAAPYAASVWLRGNAGGEQIYIGVSGGPYYSIPRITLTTAWQRFSFVTPVLTAASWTITVGTDLRDGAQSATPAQTIYAWGAQVEAGAFVTSHIPTTGATVARAVDFPSFPFGAWYAAPGGSWFAEYVKLNSPSGAFKRILQVSLAGVYSQLMSDDNGTISQYDGAFLQTGTGTSSSGTIARAVSSWGTGGQGKICLNGGAIATTAALTNGYPATGPIVILSTSVPGDSITGYIRRINYWPRILSDAEMKSMTS